MLFQGIILRHGSEVQTMKLRYITVTDEDYRIIYLAMGRCSEWMRGHDKSRAITENRPSPAEIERDIGSLRAFVKSVNVRKETIERQRAASVKPITPPAG